MAGATSTTSSRCATRWAPCASPTGSNAVPADTASPTHSASTSWTRTATASESTPRTTTPATPTTPPSSATSTATSATTGGATPSSLLFVRPRTRQESRTTPAENHWLADILDVVAAGRELRDRHANIHVIGSLNFVQTLFAERLFDRLTLWVYPILLGGGRKVFADGVVPTNLRLMEPAVASPKGAVLRRYALADGTPGVGDMSVVDQEG
ncbi:dihydrofolate reductase family protein [Paenarthrobacter sp. PH39-S1]|uniref:dihydrofolate reductase family protein n=1 Tax=Paenarthrobacter sp. PH39-S1 TaxID=3046204 RepID=UPI0024B941EB|nr:dihydrofolate reductase family protein [Paenarthrobacter sp. PH39-S1]MDJ0356595.1 dihydrofolate reductase family protein [Paenarthrobacter sp. PH39-S1]